ncbi:uncharacterized protein LOC128316497 isoform X2 [Acinonyx jubatus]|uniref:Uncharacterized protein LOC128316497 isoform X2 n=1 Tax=Acinonyx jubatus TaxID=32536 RepID=A0ABM3QFP1_ACIJB|nr:uncharacterized protein LOC128316497 isoform X2 [Acinonyx jubatus]
MVTRSDARNRTGEQPLDGTGTASSNPQVAPMRSVLLLSPGERGGNGGTERSRDLPGVTQAVHRPSPAHTLTPTPSCLASTCLPSRPVRGCARGQGSVGERVCRTGRGCAQALVTAHLLPLVRCGYRCVQPGPPAWTPLPPLCPLPGPPYLGRPRGPASLLPAARPGSPSPDGCAISPRGRCCPQAGRGCVPSLLRHPGARNRPDQDINRDATGCRSAGRRVQAQRPRDPARFHLLISSQERRKRVNRRFSIGLEKERASERAGERQRERERESQAASVPSARSPTRGSNPQTVRSRPEPKSRVGCRTD